ncbi:A-kinase anchor protein 12 isoform X2 [Nycticebus coucang]|uniref:A-kinase anchor protein 12 isoform X2 n=1 Tax=Nycticebus coucang TaxID=9470 RepID=UPI00234C3E9B|nr:A-kinase anchor protein 12 isoform X2 [Nycticebus coucang]
MLGTVTITVGQRDSEDVSERDANKEMAANSEVVPDITSDGQEMPEITEQVPSSESNLEELTQPTESQANDIGFKKVFKFVGLKFTVKKDKSEKSDAVQLLTVKKDEGEGAAGAGDHPDPSLEGGETAAKESEFQQSTEKPQGALKQEQSHTEISLQAESGQAAEEGKEEGEVKKEKESSKSPESPTSPVTSETASSFKKFFTQGWAGWRKKTSFRKPKEEDLEGSEKKKGPEPEKADTEDKEKAETSSEKPTAPEQPLPLEVMTGAQEARLSAEYEKVELPLEDQGSGLQGSPAEKLAPLATEVFDEKVEVQQEVVADVHVSTEEHTEEQEAEVQETVESLPSVETDAEPQEAEAAKEPVKAEEVCAPGEAHPQEPEPGPDEKVLPKHPEGLVSEMEMLSSQEGTEVSQVEMLSSQEGTEVSQVEMLSSQEGTEVSQVEMLSSQEGTKVSEVELLSSQEGTKVSEAEMLSSQERTKVQGSPLKKLFTSTGLKKLSGKKQKGKRGGGGDEESGEQSHIPADSPDSNDEQKGESSASSPDEPEEITCLEKGIADTPPEVEVEEGPTSDGEKKREGITPWASFKKMVTPKKRVRRPSESDKEDELDKVKSATLSSTESAASEIQEEVKGSAEEQKLEEPKRKVDTSVSWEALICVGSSKKRARKASSSDEEGAPKTLGGDSQRADETGKDKEPGTEAMLASSQEHDPGRGSSSPEQAGSPSEGEGVSTWESFKRLVTARKKSKSKLEEKNEDSVTGSGIEHSASDVEPGKEESWVSIKKFMPGRRKKRPDGKQEPGAIEDTGPAEVNEDDADVPAVVPLSEYDAVEMEKMEAQQAQKSAEKPEQTAAVDVSEELSKRLVHTVAVAVVDGTRAATSVEERSPSWISASVTEIEPVEQEEEGETTPLTGEVLEREVIAEETSMVSTSVSENRDACDNLFISEVQVTSEAVTAAETTEAFCAEEAAERSGAEETTEMVSAVSQLTDSPDTTEEATPVQEIEGGMPDIDEQERRTQEVLQAVAEKVKEESQLHGTTGPEDTIQAMQKVESELSEELEEAEEDSKSLGLEREMDVVLKVHAQQTKTEQFTQGEEVQATPESFEEAPQFIESVESSELISTGQAETSAGVKSQEITVEQAIPPDSVETLTGSETSGSAPVANLEALDAAQQDEIVETQEDDEAASRPGVTEAESVPAQKERLPASPGLQSQEEKKEQAKVEAVLEHTDEEVSVETVPILKTEVMQEAGQCADEETRDTPFVKGLEVPVDTDVMISQEKVTEIALKDEVLKEAEREKNGTVELQSPTKSLPSPVERERVGEMERESLPSPVEREMVVEVEKESLPSSLESEMVVEVERESLPTPVEREMVVQVERESLPTPVEREMVVEVEREPLPTPVEREMVVEVERESLPTPVEREMVVEVERESLPSPVGREMVVQVERESLPTPVEREMVVQVEREPLPSPVGREMVVQVEREPLPSPVGREMVVQVEREPLPSPVGREMVVQVEREPLPSPVGREMVVEVETESLPSSVEREMVVEEERDEVKAEPAQVSKEKLEQKTGVSVSEEPTVSEEPSVRLVQTFDVTVTDGEKEVSHVEGSPLPCLGEEEAICTEVQVQSSEASLTLSAAVVEEKVLGEAVKILEIGETLESAGAHLVLEEKPTEKGEDFTALPGEEAEPTGPESRAESIPEITSATSEKGLCSDLEGEKTTSRKWKSDEVSEQVVYQEVRVSVARQEDLKAGDDVLELETESSKLVKNIIQTAVDQLAVDQFVRTEETAIEAFTSDLQTQTHLVRAESQGAGQKTEKEESEWKASAQDETQTSAVKEETELSAGRPVHSDVSKDMSDASEKTTEVESCSVNDQQLEELLLPSEKAGDGTGTQSVPEDDGGSLLEGIEKSRFESKEDEKGEAVDYPENQNSALAYTYASGDLTKESSDTNGLTQKEEDAQEAGFQEGKVLSESDTEIKTKTQEETEKQERESATPELKES